MRHELSHQVPCCRAALEKARTVDEVKDIRNRAEALRVYLKQAADVDMQNWAAEIRIRAERRAGELLREMPKQQAAAMDISAAELTRQILDKALRRSAKK